MADPWGISGPDFTKLYLALIVAPIVVGLLWRWAQTALVPADRTPRGPLTDFHVAYLAGGRKRVGQTAVAALLESGQIRTDTLGTLHRCATPPPTDPIARAVFERCDGHRVGRASRFVGSAIDPLVRDLRGRGLVVGEAATAFRRAVVFLLVLAVDAVGVARLLNGVSLNRPVNNLIVLLVINTFVLIVLLTRLVGERHRTTADGARALYLCRGQQRTRMLQGAGAGMAFAGGAVAAVALGGIMAYPDDDVVQALSYVPASGGSGNTSSGSSCSSGGSSCGGGGCGGGGCGG